MNERSGKPMNLRRGWVPFAPLNAKSQVRTPSGDSIWKASELQIRVVKVEGGPVSQHPWVEWNGKRWMRKMKSVTLCEVVGYQLAAMAGIPLLNWVAFFKDDSAEQVMPCDGFAILVERWDTPHREVPLLDPASEFPREVAAGLALGVFDRYEWPVWLVGDRTLRLIDLERIGPQVTWPPQRTRLRFYEQSTEKAYQDARAVAQEVELEDLFHQCLDKLINLDFSRVLDLSGHPFAKILAKTIAKGLEMRNWELRRILHGVTRPIQPARNRPLRINQPRHSTVLVTTLEHDRLGRLQGSIRIRPVRRGWWSVSWNIGDLDRDAHLSHRWFASECYWKNFDSLLEGIYRRVTPRRIKFDSPTPRWGLVKVLTQELAVELAHGIQHLWDRILVEWKAGSAFAFEDSALRYSRDSQTADASEGGAISADSEPCAS